MPNGRREHPVSTTNRSVRAAHPDIRGVPLGRTATLEQVYERHGRQVYSLVLRMVRDPEAAQDLTQEVFVRVWRGMPTYCAAKGRLDSWILTIARNASLDELRRREAHRKRISSRTGTDPFAMVPDGAPRVEELVLAAESSARARRTIRRALRELPPRQREVIHLLYFRGLTYSEAAAATGAPLGTIKTRARRALQRLRPLMPDAS